MSNKQSNYPQARFVREIEATGDFVNETVMSISSISELAINGRPKDVKELRERITDFFSFCAEKNFRPGVEALALALGVNRTTFWRWCNKEDGVSDEWADTCKTARQSIVAFVEAAANSGKLSPPIAIFSLKNLANWKDTVSFEDVTPAKDSDSISHDIENIKKYRLESGDDEE